MRSALKVPVLIGKCLTITALIVATATAIHPLSSGMGAAALPDIASAAWAEETFSGTRDSPQSTPTATPPFPQQDTQQPLMPAISPDDWMFQPKNGHQDTRKPGEPVKPLTAKDVVNFMDLLHGELSKQIVDAASWMDSYFADESYVKEENHSYVRFRYDVFKEERAPMTFNPAFDLRLGLPELERKTHLVFSAEPAQPANDVNTPVQTAGERFGQSEQRSLTTAIHYLFRSTAQESFFVRAGMQFSNLSPVVLVEPRYRVLFPLDAWNIRFTQDVIWKSNTSWQTDTRFDFERLLPYALFFRTSVDGIWAARVKGYIYSLSFSVRQALTPTHALDYVWVNTYQTRQVGELTEVAFSVRYRHSYWRKWLFFELAPQVRFPRTGNFDILPGVLFRIEMFFGG